MHRQNLVVFGLLGLLLTTAMVPVAFGADSDYTLMLGDPIETPSRTVSIGGEDHTVSAVGRTTPGSNLSATVDAPSDTAYDVLLYNGNRQIVASKEGSGDQSFEFNMTGYKPGSYLLTIYKNGDYKDVFPVVVRGYTVTVDAPSRAAAESNITVTVTAEKTETVEDPSQVQIVLANDDQTVRATATKEASNKYRATLSLENIPTGDARIYAVVQGSDDAFKEGRKELLGISDASSLTVYQKTTQTTTESTDSPGTTGTTTTNNSTTVTTVNSTTRTTTPPTTTTAINTSPQSPSTTTTPRPSTRTATTQTSNTDVITPNKSTTVLPTTPSPAIPGFGLSSSLAALCCLLILALRR